jgi:hypothetical protein
MASILDYWDYLQTISGLVYVSEHALLRTGWGSVWNATSRGFSLLN